MNSNSIRQCLKYNNGQILLKKKKKKNSQNLLIIVWMPRIFRELFDSKNSEFIFKTIVSVALQYSPDPIGETIHSMKGNRTWIGISLLLSTSPSFRIKSTISSVHVVPYSTWKMKIHIHLLYLKYDQILVRTFREFLKFFLSLFETNWLCTGNKNSNAPY